MVDTLVSVSRLLKEACSGGKVAFAKLDFAQ